MTNDPSSRRKPADEVLDLAWALCEGSITDSEKARLEELLSDASNRADYTQFIQLIAALEWEGSNSFASNLDVTDATARSLAFATLTGASSKRNDPKGSVVPLG